MKKKSLLAVLAAVAVVMMIISTSVFAAENDGTNLADEGSSSDVISSVAPSSVPDESVATDPPADSGGETESSVSSEPSASQEPESTWTPPAESIPEAIVSEEPESQITSWEPEDPTWTDSGDGYESAATGSLLPETSNDGASGTTSHDWNQLLENINSENAAGTEDGTFVFGDDPNNTNQTGENDGGWMLWLGIGLIFLAVCGISYVVYANFFSKKCPRKRLAAAQVAQRAKIQTAKHSTAVSQQKNIPAKRRPDSSSEAYGDGYHYTKKSASPSNQNRTGSVPRRTDSSHAPEKPPQSRQYKRTNNDDFWDKFFDK